MRIVFMGTPDFAVTCLERLIATEHEIVAVYSQPDKPVGRKREILPTPVKECALKHSISVYQPESLRNAEQIEALKKLKPDVVVVVAYGKLIPADMLKIAPLGFVNVHASILPKYRGAAPIQWSIVNGDKVTGVTTMLLNEGMDTGDILETAVTEIGASETAGELFERLSVLGAELAVSTLDKLGRGELIPIKQDEALASVAPIIRKEMALLDFGKTAEEIVNAVRGFNPWPIAYTYVNGKRLKVFAAAVSDEKCDAAKSTVVRADNKLCVACSDGVVELIEVQLEGSRRMSAADFVKGRGLSKGALLGV